LLAIARITGLTPLNLIIYHHTQLQVKRAYPEIPRSTGTTNLRDAFGIVLVPSPLRPGVIGANSYTSSQKRPKKISTSRSPATSKPQKNLQHRNIARLPVASIPQQDPSPPQEQQTQTERPVQAKTHDDTLPLIDFTDRPPTMPLPNSISSINPGNTEDVLQVFPL